MLPDQNCTQNQLFMIFDNQERIIMKRYIRMKNGHLPSIPSDLTEFSFQHLPLGLKVKCESMRVSEMHFISSLFPQHDWKSWMFPLYRPNLNWKSRKDRKGFFEWLWTEFGIYEMSDWYKQSWSKIKKFCGVNLSKIYSSSLIEALKDIYPQHDWNFLSFKFVNHASNKFLLQDEQNILNGLGKELGYKRMDDWYSITLASFLRHRSSRNLLTRYKSVINAVTNIFPFHEWQLWQFKEIPSTLFSRSSTRRDFFDWFIKTTTKTNIQTPEHFFSIKKQDFLSSSGGVALLIPYFSNDLRQCIRTLYPEIDWHPLKYFNLPASFWKKEENRKEYIDWLGRNLEVKEMSGWYNVTLSNTVLSSYSPTTTIFLKHYDNSLVKAIVTLYPSHDWLPWLFSPPLSSSYWTQIENHRKYLNWVLSLLHGVQTPTDFINEMEMMDITKLEKSFLFYHNNSIEDAIQFLYPEVKKHTHFSFSIPSNDRFSFFFLFFSLSSIGLKTELPLLSSHLFFPTFS